jgi:Family of unknown function (DUF6082)
VSRRVVYRVFRNTSIAILVVGGVGLIVVSPAGLNLLSAVKGVNWLKLSSIGQTYGAVSALISGIALAGVVISLILQSHELNLAREQAFRTYHFDLIRFAIDNPSFISSWGYVPSEGASLEDVRKAGYTNMIVSFWGTGTQQDGLTVARSVVTSKICLGEKREGSTGKAAEVYGFKRRSAKKAVRVHRRSGVRKGFSC